MDESIVIRSKPMPLDRHVKQGHPQGQMRLECLPRPMTHMLELTAYGQHRQDCFNRHAGIPGVTKARFQIRWFAHFGMKSSITQYNHDLFNSPNHGLKDRIGPIGCVTVPCDDQSPLIQQQIELAPHNSAVIRDAFFFDLNGTPPFSNGMNQFHAIGINDAQHGRIGQKPLCPMLMRLKQPEQPCPVRQGRTRPCANFPEATGKRPEFLCLSGHTERQT